MSEALLGAIGVVGILGGMYGTVVPVVPGLVIVWLSTVGTLLLQGTSPLGWTVVVVLTLLMIVGMIASMVLPARRAAASGAPRSSLALAAVGAIVGFFVIPVLGMLIGGVLGLLVAEQRRLDDWAPAWASSKEVLKGYGLGVLLELTVGAVMGVTWLVTFAVRAI